MKMLTDNLIRPKRARFPLHASLLTLLSASAEPGNPPKCGQNLYMRNEPNFQSNSLTLSAVMAGTYNANMLINRGKKRTQNGTKMNKNRKKNHQNERKRAKFHPKNTPTKPKPYPN